MFALEVGLGSRNGDEKGGYRARVFGLGLEGMLEELARMPMNFGGSLGLQMKKTRCRE